MNRDERDESGPTEGFEYPMENTPISEFLDEAHQHEEDENRQGNDHVVEFSSSSSVPSSPTCWNRFMLEWKLGMFGVTEYDGKFVDVARSFQLISVTRMLSPDVLFVMVSKLVFTLWAVSVLIIDAGKFSSAFWLAWLTNWALLVAVSYLLLSLLSSIFGSVHSVRKYSGGRSTIIATAPQEDDVGDDENDKEEEHFPTKNVEGANSTTAPLSVWIRMAWTMACLAGPLQLLVTILYWTLVYSPPVNPLDGYLDFMRHGGVALFTWIDALIINRTPVRFRQITILITVALLYILWTLIHGLWTDIGNPNIDGDAIYDVLNWQDDPVGAFVVSLLAVAVGIPLVFFLFWAASAYGCSSDHHDASSKRAKSCCSFQNGHRRHQVVEPSVFHHEDEVIA